MIEIFLIDDDEDIRNIFKHSFKDEIGINMTYVSNFIEGVATIVNRSFDLYIVDLKIAEYSGLELIRLLQKEKNIDNRIVLMSESMKREARIEAFNLGVSNIVDKPVDFDVLKPLLKKNIRMIEGVQRESLKLGNLEINTAKFTCKNIETDEFLHLTKTEFHILVRLLQARGRVIPKDELSYTAKNGEEPMSYKSLEMKIVTLRRKLGTKGELIKTIRGIGYAISQK
ncbi:MAG: response regulator transcription factor [Halobacteriovoraceae bacterium]|nr:response regulator transcription factor [Halobacteriovoraceae bacterium]